MTELSLTRADARPGPDWLRERRRRAAEAFAGLPLPTTEEEIWRYSRINDLDPGVFSPVEHPADPGPAAVSIAGQDPEVTGIVHTVDGRVRKVTVNPDAALEVRAVGGLTDVEPDADDPMGAVAVDLAADALGALHDALADPVVIRVPPGGSGGRIVVVHETVTAGGLGCPRVVVDAGQDSEVEVVEVHCGPDGSEGLALPVTELRVGRDARMRHVVVQLVGDATWNLARLVAEVEANGRLEVVVAAFGGDYARLRVDTALVGRGAEVDITCGYFGSGGQLLDFRTFQDHVAPDTRSNLVFKGALADRSAAVYTGLIKIRPAARGSQAFQTNRNLKLSEDTWAESVPNLEIENNEVQCSHASTVGPVDAEQLFYLESRGVPPERAERLVVRGFFDEVLAALEGTAMAGLVGDRLAAELEWSDA